MNLHPATLEVVRNALYATAEETSARSPLLKEAGDLSSALIDAEGRLKRGVIFAPSARAMRGETPIHPLGHRSRPIQ